jgi:hypothetical protein
MNISTHAQQRLQQRGLFSGDLDLIMMHGIETRDGYFLRKADVHTAEQNLRQLIERLHKLEGKYVVIDGDDVITTYHPTKKKTQRILRKAKH